MRILLVNPEASLRREVEAALHGPNIVLHAVMDVPTAVQVLDTSSVPLVVLIDFRLSDWGASSTLLEVLLAHPPIALGHVFILLIFTDETIPLTFTQAMAQFPVFLAAKPLEVRTFRAVVSKAALRRSARQALLPPAAW